MIDRLPLFPLTGLAERFPLPLARSPMLLPHGGPHYATQREYLSRRPFGWTKRSSTFPFPPHSAPRDSVSCVVVQLDRYL